MANEKVFKTKKAAIVYRNAKPEKRKVRKAGKYYIVSSF